MAKVKLSMQEKTRLMPPTTQQLKADINAGKTGDKVVEGFDLGLSTLGTDDEAGGSPNTPEQVAVARALEKRHAPKPAAEQSANVSRPGQPAVWIVVGAFTLLLAVLALVLLNGHA